MSDKNTHEDELVDYEDDVAESTKESKADDTAKQ